MFIRMRGRLTNALSFGTVRPGFGGSPLASHAGAKGQLTNNPLFWEGACLG